MTPRWLVPLFLVACQPAEEGGPPLVQLRPAQVTIPPARYDTPPQFVSFNIESFDADVIYVSVAPPATAEADLLRLTLLPFTELTPGQTRAIEVSLDPQTWRWRTGNYETTIDVDARYFFSGQAEDEPELPSTSEAPQVIDARFTLTVRYSLDCDLDDDGVDSYHCAPTCPPPPEDGSLPDPCEPADCRDDLPETFPGAQEICNGRDDDCDGGIDEGALDTTTWYLDVDGDGRGDDTTARESCSRPGVTWVTTGGDCDDTRISVYPGAFDVCGDGIDNNCDGRTDETCPT